MTIRVLALVLACAPILVPAISRAECPELIRNGDLFSEQEPWKVESIPPTPLLDVSFFQGMRVSIHDPEFHIYTVEISQTFPIHEGSAYRLSFFIDSPPQAQVHVAVTVHANGVRTSGLDRDFTQADNNSIEALKGSTYATYEAAFASRITDPTADLVISFTNDRSYNPFGRLTGVSLVQVSGICYDGSSEDGTSLSESADALPAASDVLPLTTDSDSLHPRLAGHHGCACAVGHATESPIGPMLVFGILLLARTVRVRPRH